MVKLKVYDFDKVKTNRKPWPKQTSQMLSLKCLALIMYINQLGISFLPYKD